MRLVVLTQKCVKMCVIMKLDAQTSLMLSLLWKFYQMVSFLLYMCMLFDNNVTRHQHFHRFACAPSFRYDKIKLFSKLGLQRGEHIHITNTIVRTYSILHEIHIINLNYLYKVIQAIIY